MTAGLLENTENKAEATDIIKALKSAAKLIKNLESVGREKWKTKINKATGTDAWTKKRSKNEYTGNVDPIEPGATMEEVWGHSSSTATPDPPVATVGSPKPVKDNLDEQMNAPDPRILHILRTERRRHLCRRGGGEEDKSSPKLRTWTASSRLTSMTAVNETMTLEDPGNRHPMNRTKPIGPTAQDYAAQRTTSQVG